MSCSDLNADITIIAGPKHYKCQKSLLVENSDWFKMNIDKLLEDHSGSKKSLKLSLRRIPSEMFSVIFDWMWSKKLPRYCDTIGVMKCAKRLQMPELIKECHNRLRYKTLNIFNAMLKNREAIKNNFPIEICKSEDFLCRNFEKIISNGIFLNYKVEQICTLFELDDLYVTSEVEVFDAALSWLKNNWGCRSHHAIRVLSLVRYGLMEDEELFTLMFDPRCLIIMKLESMQSLILNGFFYHIAAENNKLELYPDLIPKERTNLKKQFLYKKQNSAKSVSWSPTLSPNFIDNYISPIPLTPVSVLSPERSSGATPRIIQSVGASSTNSSHRTSASSTSLKIKEVLNEKCFLKPLAEPMICLEKLTASESSESDITETDDEFASRLRLKDILGRNCEKNNSKMVSKDILENEVDEMDMIKLLMNCKIPENFSATKSTEERY